ncbi:hypothetical protein FB472_1545 [Rhodoglobus vestalii]|uniref:Uncharacterized protein n=1 Tax=Rhodoglobus vestalii TaxID=193384 RepID=A0A8H2PY37_9MICO|nr:hypothetical protein [Rhodoglobus vestalii]TQO19944.1 hypothetical protein FB472_1545 [Rhodoglobus vestalii]
MVWTLAAFAIGLFAGVLLSDARTPHTRHIPLLSGFALGMSLMLILVFMTPADPSIGFVFLFGSIISSALYTAWIWSRIFPEIGLSFGQILGQEFAHPSYVRQQYAAKLYEDDLARADTDSTQR